MKRQVLYIFILYIAILFAACSTTSHLPEGEVLYTGIERTRVHDKKGTVAEGVALEEVNAALAYKPNGSLLGSSSKRSPFQIGLWLYNAYVDKPRKGFNKWMFNSFAGTPVTISQVSPDTRTKVTTNLLQNYGYFRGHVDYELLTQRDPKKQRIAYDIHLGEPYLFDSIRYAFRDSIQDSILRATEKEAYIRKGSQFSTFDLTSEKDRLVREFRNSVIADMCVWSWCPTSPCPKRRIDSTTLDVSVPISGKVAQASTPVRDVEREGGKDEPFFLMIHSTVATTSRLCGRATAFPSHHV